MKTRKSYCPSNKQVLYSAVSECNNYYPANTHAHIVMRELTTALNIIEKDHSLTLSYAVSDIVRVYVNILKEEIVL